MTGDVDDWLYERYDDLGPAKEEPDCGRCNDSRMVQVDPENLAGPLRQCPSCNPTAKDVAEAARRVATYEDVDPGAFADEPPF